MIFIGGGFSKERLERIAEELSRSHAQFDVIEFGQKIHEIFSKLGGRKKKEISQVKSRVVLTPDQEIQAENLRRKVQAILNQPPAIQRPY